MMRVEVAALARRGMPRWVKLPPMKRECVQVPMTLSGTRLLGLRIQHRDSLTSPPFTPERGGAAFSFPGNDKPVCIHQYGLNRAFSGYRAWNPGMSAFPTRRHGPVHVHGPGVRLPQADSQGWWPGAFNAGGAFRLIKVIYAA